MSGVWVAVGGVLGLLVLIVWGITLVDIFKSHLGAGKTAAWVIIVLLLPLIGSILYWVLRKPSRQEAQYAYDSQRALHDSAERQRFDSTGLR